MNNFTTQEREDLRFIEEQVDNLLITLKFKEEIIKGLQKDKSMFVAFLKEISIKLINNVEALEKNM
jgi:hypothetical protein